MIISFFESLSAYFVRKAHDIFSNVMASSAAASFVLVGDEIDVLGAGATAIAIVTHHRQRGAIIK